MSADDVLLPTDAELDSRRHKRRTGIYGEISGAEVVPDTIKRAEWAIKRLEKRAKSRLSEGERG